ncbi:MAG: hypothetical protein CMK43_08340 [Porticoccaceae bacterium]|nr:hypothetical protein [Porticoccaceae bacterium]
MSRFFDSLIPAENIQSVRKKDRICLDDPEKIPQLGERLEASQKPCLADEAKVIKQIQEQHKMTILHKSLAQQW